MIRQIGIDFGTSMSVVCYCDYKDGKRGQVKFIAFSTGGNTSVPTLILKAGNIVNRRGETVFCEEAYGWDAENAQAFHTLLERNLRWICLVKIVRNE